MTVARDNSDLQIFQWGHMREALHLSCMWEGLQQELKASPSQRAGNVVSDSVHAHLYSLRVHRKSETLESSLGLTIVKLSTLDQTALFP